MGDSRTNPEIAQLEAEMKLLKWHKLANETALQAALLSTKQIKQHDKLLKAQSIEQERLDMVDRKKKIADEEYAKPLPVDIDFIEHYERDTYKSNEARERRLGRLRDVKREVTKRHGRKHKQEQYRQLNQGVQSRGHEHTPTPISSTELTEQCHEEIPTSRLPDVSLSMVLKRLDQLAALEHIIRTGKKRDGGCVNLTESENMIVQLDRTWGSSSVEKFQKIAGDDAASRLTFSRGQTRAELLSPSRNFFAVRMEHDEDSLQQSKLKLSSKAMR